MQRNEKRPTIKDLKRNVQIEIREVEVGAKKRQTGQQLRILMEMFKSSKTSRNRCEETTTKKQSRV